MLYVLLFKNLNASVPRPCNLSRIYPDWPTLGVQLPKAVEITSVFVIFMYVGTYINRCIKTIKQALIQRVSINNI